jgi:hypothetical protein
MERPLVAAAGSMWKKAPPRSEPAANATSGVRRLSRVSLRRRNVTLPTSAMALMSMPLPTIQASVVIDEVLERQSISGGRTAITAVR